MFIVNEYYYMFYYWSMLLIKLSEFNILILQKKKKSTFQPEHAMNLVPVPIWFHSWLWHHVRVDSWY